MIDVRTILLTGLVTKLGTVTDTPVYSVMPKEKDLKYPYISITEIYVNEEGPKNQFFYNCDVSLNIEYKNQSSKLDLYADINNVLSIVDNLEPFELSGNLKIMSGELISSLDSDYKDSDSSVISFALIHLKFDIEDNN